MHGNISNGSVDKFRLTMNRRTLTAMDLIVEAGESPLAATLQRHRSANPGDHSLAGSCSIEQRACEPWSNQNRSPRALCTPPTRSACTRTPVSLSAIGSEWSSAGDKSSTARLATLLQPIPS
jgi:hypothetical protein